MKRFSEWSAFKENQGLAQMSSSGNTPIAGTGTQQIGSAEPDLEGVQNKQKMIAFLNSMQDLKDPSKRGKVLDAFLGAFIQHTGLDETKIKSMISKHFGRAPQAAAQPAQSQEPQAGGAAQQIQQPPAQQTAQRS